VVLGTGIEPARVTPQDP